MRFRLIPVTVACALAALIFPLMASAEARMMIGFQDDPSLRWRDDRLAAFDLAQKANAGIVRTTVYWSRIAEERPANPTNPFDPGYRFDDLDEFVRNAGLHGMEVMLTIWGTPSWANGGKGQNYAPTDATDMENFARALASRYSGRYNGYPFVRYYTVWNESNLGQFLSPQYDSKGKPVAPKIYAKIYRAAYAGIKAGSRRALIGIGETSARGRDRFLGRQGTQETESPGNFAKLLAAEKPLLKFDAWSHHPYPTSPSQPPTQNVRWPNVTLTQLPRFEDTLKTLFNRKQVPIWITEYGYETSPPDRVFGVAWKKQAAYLRQAYGIARRNPRIEMLLWFLARDEARMRGWQSGFVSAGGRRKPSFYEFQTLAAAARKRQVTLVRAVRRKQVRELDDLLRGVVGVKGDAARSWLPFAR
jgi:Cellulase (glycosyl hydrolase family 5)